MPAPDSPVTAASSRGLVRVLTPDAVYQSGTGGGAKIVDRPEDGEEKKGDLAGVRVFKLACIHQTFLLAYTWDGVLCTLLSLGPHENFYRDLKR
ncbi:type II toxin-antitoxin system RelE/ParE family toxin [Allochromatium vinosum]|uniref:type II toxin-antitoxin system RelE/ParE family toxin n=1 Tax=Allochromatium vinosum TaxID=1049 RepID=UPI0030B82CA7